MSRWALRIGALLTVILLLAAGAGVAFFDPNDFKPEIVRAVWDATGRTITLTGPLRVSWTLRPTFEITDVSLANLPGGTRSDIARVERIEAQLSILALLRREVEVVKLTLTGPNILFEQVGGKPNWSANVPDVAPTTPPKLLPASGFAPTFTLRVRTVQIRNGMVTWHFPERTKVVGIRSLELQHPVDGGPLDLAAILVYSDYQPFSLKASAQPTGAFNDPRKTKIDVAAFDTIASATGTADVGGSFNLQVEAKTGALEKLNALLPDMRLPPLHQATLSTHLLNGPALGALPVPGATRLSIASADFEDRIKGLTLGATELLLAEAGGTARVSALGQFAGQSFTLAGTVGVPLHLDGRVSVPVDLQAQVVAGVGKAPTSGGEGSLALTGKFALTGLRFGGLDLTVDLRTPALAALRPLLSPSLPALTNVRFDGRMVVPADAASVAFENANLLTREGDVTGNWALGQQARLTLDGKLVSQRLDMDLMLAAFGIELPPWPAFGGNMGPVISTAPLPWGLLRGPMVSLSARVDAMTFQGQVWNNVDFKIDLERGRLQMSPLTLSLPDGQLLVSMTVDASRDTVPVSLEMHAPGVPLALAARYAGLPGPMSGAIRIDAVLHASGLTPHDLAASLDGTVSAALIGGRMTNATFIMLTSASLEALGINVPAQGETELHCLGLVGSFTKGVGLLPTIALDTTYLQADGIGQIDLAQETVTFKLHPLVQISGSAIAVPVVIEGPFHAVKGRLDADGIDKLGLFIDSLFGSDRSTACIDAGFVPDTMPRGKQNERP